MKKILAIVLVVVMIASSGIVAFAQDISINFLNWPTRVLRKTSNGYNFSFSYNSVPLYKYNVSSDSWYRYSDCRSTLTSLFSKYGFPSEDSSKSVFITFYSSFVYSRPLNNLSSGYVMDLTFVKDSSHRFSVLFHFNPNTYYLHAITFSEGSSLSFNSNNCYFFGDYIYSYDSSLKSITDIGNFEIMESSTNTVLVSKNTTTNHTLTVNYLYSEGNPATDPITQTVTAGEEYSIPSPEIEGYTPSIPIVTGTMPDEDLTIDVIYSKSFYPLTVKYQYQNGSKAADDMIFQYPLGFAYDIPSPQIAGYQPDKPTVSGTMPGNALEEVVTYAPIQYDLTIDYRYQDGSQAANAHQEQLPAGAAYSVTSPTVEGYTPDMEVVSGSMPAKDISFTVTYQPDDPGGGGEGPGGGGEDPGGDSGGGDDPFGIPSQPPFSGYDPFLISGLPGWSGYDPFKIRGLPSYSYDPFVIPEK